MIYARDLAILVFGAGIPAGLALLLLRKSLFAARGAWSGVMFGMAALTGLALVAIWAAYAFAEQQATACTAAGGVDCQDSFLVVVMVGMPAVVSIIVFLAAAVLIRVWRGRRKDA